MLYLIPRQDGFEAKPLEKIDLSIDAQAGTRLCVTDGQGNEYVNLVAKKSTSFLVGAALGTHHARLIDAGGAVLAEASFRVAAQTQIEDRGGVFRDLLRILYKTMCCYSPTGAGSIKWRGQEYANFVPWILDHVHTARGMVYFSDATRGLVDLLTQIQREDGMIWSQVEVDGGHPDFFDTRDENRNFYTRRDGGIRMMRQPVENHCEYNFVDCVHLIWKSGGDDQWMREHLEASCRALDYTRNSRARWSEKFGLLKRGYTVDSWDFQITDEYSVPFPIGGDLRIDEERTKFGIFFGDNTGYARACEQLAEMLEQAGRADDALKFRDRGRAIRERLDQLTWNGRFFQHRVEEDPTVKRNLGVDEKAQVAMSNAYSLNRGISEEQSRAIIKTYQELKANLPDGSPGEWYAIYPPFGRGLGDHTGQWQYMNGGVHGHAAGELARGALAHGAERYGAEILLRLRDLAHAHGDMLRFAYTGAYPPAPPAQNFTTIDLAPVANMDLRSDGPDGVFKWMLEEPGNDLRNLPTGEQSFAGVPYQITDPAKNGGKAAVAVSIRPSLPEKAELPISRRAAAVYLLHTASAGASGIGGSVTLKFEDGTEHAVYLTSRKHFSGWWFPELTAPDAGVAWRGPNEKSSCVGLSWVCLENPQPGKTIRSLVFMASRESGIYAAVAVTLADRMPYHRPDPVSFGGPDNWAGGTTMAALIEGLAGVQDREGATAFREVVLSPRWVVAGVDEVRATVVYPASGGYVSYAFKHDPKARKIEVLLTGSGEEARLRILLPEGAESVAGVTVNGVSVVGATEFVEASLYVIVALDSVRAARLVEVFY